MCVYFSLRCFIEHMVWAQNGFKSAHRKHENYPNTRQHQFTGSGRKLKWNFATIYSFIHTSFHWTKLIWKCGLHNVHVLNWITVSFQCGEIMWNLTHCGLVKLYGIINLDQHSFMWWLVAQGYQAIISTNVNLVSMRSRGVSLVSI